MITIRKSNDRGHTDHGWLKTRDTFSFGEYRDPQHTGFRALRVLTEGWISAAAGFPMHPHKDMEILSYVIEGTVAHEDSLGNQGTITAGEFQLMSAGTGIQHREFNPSGDQEVHMLQIWIEPHTKGLPPSYAQLKPEIFNQENQLHLIASPDASDDSLAIHQDAKVWLGKLSEASERTYQLPADRHVWIQVTQGNVSVGDQFLTEGDGASLSNQTSVVLRADSSARLLLFDLG